MRAPSTLLRVITALCLAPLVGCPVEPPPDEPKAQLSFEIDDITVNVGATTTITVRSTKADASAGTSDITGTINKTAGTRAEATIARAADLGSAGDTATGSPDDTGRAAFAVTCVTTGTATIDFATDDLKASTQINCVDEARDVTLNIDDCVANLQADGISSCRVGVRVEGANDAVTFSVALEAVTDAAGNVVGTKPAVLKKAPDDASGAVSLTGVQLINGAGEFFITNVSKEFTLPLLVTDTGNNKERATVVVAPVDDRTSVALTSDDPIAEEAEAEFTVTATAPNGLAAPNDTPVTITVTNGTLVDGGCLAAGVATLTNGSCEFKVAVGEGIEPVTVTATVEFGDFTSTIARTVSVTPLGTLQVKTEQSEDTITPAGAVAISANASPTSAVTVQLIKGNAGNTQATYSNATVTVSIATASRSLLKLKSGDNLQPDASSLTVPSPTNGLVSFVVEAFAPRALGNGVVDIVVVDNDGGERVTRTVNIKVERKLELSQLIFDSFDTLDTIGVPGGSLPTSTGVVFKLLDERNAPVANELVTFTALSSAPDINVIPDGTSDATGLVRTVVSSGTVASPITVRATVASRPTLVADSLPIAVVGGQPNSATSAFLCETKAAFSPFETDCAASLNDRFTNVVGAAVNVQFRAEGGNIPANVLAGGGAATAKFVFSEPGPGSADVLEWSHSVVRPTSATNTLRTAFPGCFDSTNRSTCDLFAICTSTNAAINVFCPLAPSKINDAPAVCVADISADAVTALALGGDPATFADWELEAFSVPGSNAERQLLAYDRDHRACGLPLSCLSGSVGAGLIGDIADNCPINAGCLDFTTATECPQAGLLDVLASVRGEEAFDDENGNGVRDADESFIDYPEPFLDKNSSCSYDNVNGLARLTANEKVRLSDIFINSPSQTDDTFGFDGDETNGVYDQNAEIFLKTSIVLLQGARQLQFGEPVAAGLCGANGATAVTCRSTDTGSGLGNTSRCTENALSHLGGDALLGSCRPVASEFRDNDIVNMAFRWTDANGNCPSNDFAGTPSIAVDGPAKVFFNSAAYSDTECGASPGSVQASNAARPWCEEHEFMGSRLREVQIQADCNGLNGTQPVKLTFSLDETSVTQFISVGCPVCGDGDVEGEEECDETSATCDPVECTRIEP